MRSTLKCDIMSFVKPRDYCMKTKIIYISGNEIFDMNDIRAAFNEVRNALNLAKDTVLFGVPIDEDDIGLAPTTDEVVKEPIPNIPQIEPINKNDSDDEEIIHIEPAELQNAMSEETSDDDVETVAEKPQKTRGRPRKNKKEVVEEPAPEPEAETEPEESKVIPILSVLSAKKGKKKSESEPEEEEEEVVDEESEEEIIDDENEEIVDEESEEYEEYETSDEEESEEIVDEAEEESDDEKSDTETSGEIFDAEIPDLDDATENQSETEPDIEKLLSKMPSLNEDATTEATETTDTESSEPEEDVDETLAKLATEFAEAQDSISSKRKNSGGSFIGKLRGRLPFHPKTKDQGLTDLFNWSGLAANDEDFSVPGFFTKPKDKK